MSTDNFDNIDDLFRSQLDGHATPPGDELWARLQAATPPPAEITAETSPVDIRFREVLARHATPPARELWERLEDEHLRPRKRRPAAAWWPLALAASVALFLLAGGAGLWLAMPFGQHQSGAVASHRRTPHVLARNDRAPKQNAVIADVAAMPATAAATENIAKIGSKNPEQRELSGISQKKGTAQATRLATLASTAPKATAAFPGARRSHQMGAARPQDAAAEPALLVARTAPRPAAADERQPAPVVAQALVPAAEIVPAPTAPALASASELITVDVRNGAASALRPARAVTAAVAAAIEPSEGRLRLGGRLLRQVGHLARGERVSLAEVTGLPENLTLHATVAGRSISKSIQL